jgi:hypothetical protein
MRELTAVEIYSSEDIRSTGLQLEWILPETVTRLTLCGVAIDDTLYTALSASNRNIRFLEIYRCTSSAVQRLQNQIILPNLRVYHTNEVTTFTCLQMPCLEEFQFTSSNEKALDPHALLRSIASVVMNYTLKRLILRRNLSPLNNLQSNSKVNYHHFL